MALINLALSQLERIESNISSIDNELISKTLPRIESAINSLAENIQGTELQPLIKKINNQYDSIKSGLSKGFTTLEDFLKNQLKSYRLTEEEAEEELRNTLMKMSSLASTAGLITNMKPGDGLIIDYDIDPDYYKSNKQTQEDGFINDLKEKWNSTNEFLTDKVTFLKNKAQGGIEGAVDKIDNAYNKVGDYGNNTLDKIGNAANKVTDTASSEIRNLGKGTKVEKVTDFVSTGIDKIGDGANYVTDKIGDGFNKVMETPGKILNGAEDIAKNKVFDGDWKFWE